MKPSFLLLFLALCQPQLCLEGNGRNWWFSRVKARSDGWRCPLWARQRATHDRQGRPCRPLCSGFPSAAELPAYRKLFILRAKKKNTIISPKLAQITVLWQFSMRRTSRKRNLKRNKNLKKQHMHIHVTYVCCLFLGMTTIKKKC